MSGHFSNARQAKSFSATDLIDAVCNLSRERGGESEQSEKVCYIDRFVELLFFCLPRFLEGMRKTSRLRLIALLWRFIVDCSRSFRGYHVSSRV